MKRIAMVVPVILFGLRNGTVFGQTLRVPFDFSQSEIGIDSTVNGEPLYILFDTGVDPSVIDLKSAEALHVKIERNAGGQVSGFGNTGAAYGLSNDRPGLRDLRTQIWEL
jgi:hypothetical protein